MIDPSVLARLRAYTCCEPDSQPPTHADLGALLVELDAATLTPGGPMPEPWPGMGVETVDGEHIDRWIPDLAMVNGVWYLLPLGVLADDDDIEDNYFRLDVVTAIYNGRRRIWQRNP